jgi:hypothetical protein
MPEMAVDPPRPPVIGKGKVEEAGAEDAAVLVDCSWESLLLPILQKV